MKKSLRKRKGSGRSSRNGKQPQAPAHHPAAAAAAAAAVSPASEKPGDSSEEPPHYLTDDEVNLIIEVLKVLFNLTCNLDRKSVDEVSACASLQSR